jgi:CheY-like chemotaxis protein
MNYATSSGLKILVADDNEFLRMTMTAALKTLGHTGVVVSDGEKALRCLSQLKFDLLLLDVQMPVMDGLEVLAHIRQQEAKGRPHLPIIIVTALDLPEERARFLQLGADGYVAKPVDIDALQEEIEMVFAHA